MIDFSKAPEGATHYRESTFGVIWFKLISSSLTYSTGHGPWHTPHFGPLDMNSKGVRPIPGVEPSEIAAAHCVAESGAPIVWVVVGEFLYEYSEVISVWASEDAANVAAEKARARRECPYDYVKVERHEMGA